MWPNDHDIMLAERIVEDIDIVQRRIEYFSMTKDSFCLGHSFEDEIAYDAIMNPVYRIVEDACHLSDELTKAHPSVAWREMRGFRNFIAHGYGSINREIAWKAIRDDLPELKSIARGVLGA